MQSACPQEPPVRPDSLHCNGVGVFRFGCCAATGFVRCTNLTGAGKRANPLPPWLICPAGERCAPMFYVYPAYITSTFQLNHCFGRVLPSVASLDKPCPAHRSCFPFSPPRYKHAFPFIAHRGSTFPLLVDLHGFSPTRALALSAMGRYFRRFLKIILLFFFGGKQGGNDGKRGHNS